MSEKKHIDRIFQEKLKNLEVSPGDEIWGKISQELGQKNQDRKLIPIWWKLAGAAAIVILLFTVGNFIFNQDDLEQNLPVIVDSDNSEESNIELKNDSIIVPKEEINKSILNSKNAPQNTSESNNAIVESNMPADNYSNSATVKNKKNVNAKAEISSATVLANQENGADNLPSVTKNKTSEPIEKGKAETEDKGLKEILKRDVIVSSETDTKTKAKDIRLEEIINNESSEELFVDQEKEKIPLTEEVIVNNEDIDEEEKENINRWQIYPNVAPVYFNSLGKGSSLDSQFNNNPKTGELNTSYGVNVGYAINDKITLKTGFNALALSYDTDNVILYQNIGASQSVTASFRNIKINNPEITMISASNVSAQQVNSILGSNSKAAISQRLDYFEIPLEVDYKLIDKKTGVNLTGGFSTFFLRNNEVVSEFDGFNTYIGEANNINDISYSLNFGLGFDFPLSKRMSFNIDPKFKYQINTFKNTSGNFRPYIIGLYTGLNYKF
jgi:hypothetical protein